MKHDREAYELINGERGTDFKATDIFYKITYLDAIKEYSDNWNKAVYKMDYKDVNAIKEKDPVFDIIYKDCLFASKGKTTAVGKDPYNTKLISEEKEKKRVVKVKDFTIPKTSVLAKTEIADHDLVFDSNFE